MAKCSSKVIVSAKFAVAMLPGKIRRYIFNIVGSCLILLGLLHGLFSEAIFNQVMEQEMILRPNSKIFDLWRTPPLKLTLNFYIFNWTNPEDFQNLDIKPKFEELGPYRFTEVPNKVDIKWHTDNASMTYKKQSKYYFDAEGSKGRLDDEIVTVNSLAVSLSSKAKRWSSLRRRVIDIALKVYHDDITIKKSVDELLFGGYEDVLLNVANYLPSSLIDVKVPFDKFGYCYPRNLSADVTGTYNIYTGADDIRKFGQIHTWNYRETTREYAPECGKVYGSPGEFQSLYLQPEKPVNFFLSDVCRTVAMDYVQPEVVEGVKGFRYEGGKRMVDNGTLYPENVCHCNGQCVPSGLMNISSCWYGSPIFLSYPHFHEADPYYLAEVDGLKPEKEKHELYLVLEPRTGLMLEMTARLQSNILVEPISDFSMFRNKRRVFFPLFWFEAKTRISSELAKDFQLLPRLILLSQVFGGICALVGVALLAWYPIKRHLQNRLIQQIKINNLDNGTPHRVVGKTISLQPEVSPLLVAAVQDTSKILERADTTLSELSTGASTSSTDRSSMQSATSST
ncbi:protein peste-like isoform X1 [Rhagoletis pomonella]|uniref:protein peste-like isoform X1 n=2 Tax=Rhagoletis pomonella TaxID=28610 RepID=UPI00177EDBE9|nr:protein peste-like isoform X1 [Rhagoletis pomonella]